MQIIVLKVFHNASPLKAPYQCWHEEYAIHDTDNFPIDIGEYVSIEELNEMYEMIEELPDYVSPAYALLFTTVYIMFLQAVLIY